MESTSVQFELSQSGRRQLEAICCKCDEYAQNYKSLRYQLLVPWSDRGQVLVSETHWKAFLSAQDESAIEYDWFRWDGPHESAFGQWFGMWLGSPHGLNEFGELCGSIATVFRDERSSNTCHADGSDANGHDQWIWQMHDWSSRFDIPGLRSDLFIWDSDADAFEEPCEFVEVAERWRLGRLGPYPEHPFVWRFVDNMFTASAAAMRSILNPFSIATSNDGWFDETLPLLGRTKATARPEIPAHRLVQHGKKWTLRLYGATEAKPIVNEAGIERIAYLHNIAPGKLNAIDLTNQGGYRAKAPGPARRLADTESGDVSTDRVKPERIEKQTQDSVREGYEELVAKRAHAKAQGDIEQVEEYERRMESVRKLYDLDVDNMTVRKQGEPDTKERQKPIRSARESIKRALREISSCDAVAGSELAAQIRCHNGDFWFEKDDAATPWAIERG